MSYDIRFTHDNGEIVTFDELHDVRGGTFAVGGTDEAWINITYNYGGFFKKVFGEDGIRTLYGKTATEVIRLLDEAIPKLGIERTNNYWDATPGNAGAALDNLRTIAKLCPPDAIISGD